MNFFGPIYPPHWEWIKVLFVQYYPKTVGVIPYSQFHHGHPNSQTAAELRTAKVGDNDKRKKSAVADMSVPASKSTRKSLRLELDAAKVPSGSVEKTTPSTHQLGRKQNWESSAGTRRINNTKGGRVDS